MRDRARLAPAAAIVVLAVVVTLVGTPVIGAAPQPVIEVPRIPRKWLPPPKADEQPAQDNEQGPPGPACLNASSPATSVVAALMSSRIQAGQRATYPEPVLPAPGRWSRDPISRCLADLSLLLVIKSPDERKPDDADATLEELFISQAALESGFAVRMQALSRTIEFNEPRDDWELVGTSCTCVGGSATAVMPGMRLASTGSQTRQPTAYPGPVLPGRRGAGRRSCPPAPTQAPRAGEQSTTSAVQFRSQMTYPSPVLPEGPPLKIRRDDVDDLAVPEPPPLRPARIGWNGAGKVSIDDPDQVGGVFECVWTVELTKGRFTVTTVTDPPGAEDHFEYRITPQILEDGSVPTTMRGVPPANENGLRKGPWSVELANLGEIWTVKASSCSETDGTTVSSALGPRADLGIDPGDRVQCTFSLESMTPRAGTWRADQGRLRVSCRGAGGGFGLGLPARSDLGRITIQRGGAGLTSSGLTGGSGKIKFARDKKDPRRYVGTAKLPVQGVRATFTVTLNVVTRERASGVMTANLKAQGARCTLRRSIDFMFVGND